LGKSGKESAPQIFTLNGYVTSLLEPAGPLVFARNEG
jgi:hypothetical protein